MSSGRSKHRVGVGRTLLKLAPLLIPFGVLFLGGLVMTTGQSLGFWLPVPHEAGLLSAYARLLSPHILASATHSLWVALISTTMAVSIGAVLAYAIWRMPDNLQRLSVVYKVPLILPHIAVAFITLIFWSQSGLIASVAYQLGLVDGVADFPSIIHGGTGAGMILAYAYKEIPFVIILVYAVLKRLDPRLIQTASMLGAGPVRAFMKIAFPHMQPALHTCAIILFLYSFGAFDIPFLLSESSPGMLSIEVYNLYFKRDLMHRPEAMAILVCMLIFSLGFIAAYMRIAARLTGEERKL